MLFRSNPSISTRIRSIVTYKEKLLERIEKLNKYEQYKISSYLVDIIDMSHKLVEKDGAKYNEYEFNNIRSKINLIFKKLAYMRRNYDIIKDRKSVVKEKRVNLVRKVKNI